MDSWETLALTGFSCEDFLSRTTWSHLSQRKEKMRRNTWPKVPIDLIKFVKKISMPNSDESLKYITCYSPSSPRLVKSPKSSIRHNCQKICYCVYFPSCSVKCISCFMLGHLMTNIFQVSQMRNHLIKFGKIRIYTKELKL